MSLTLHYCWKEWRAQRGLLTAYLLLVFACLSCGFLLAPDHFWSREGNRVTVLGVFVCAGVIGVLAFATPQLVRGEFTAKDDTFVRRLPGALAPAFQGKLLFLALAAAALPLLGLLAGEWFLQATDHLWDDLFVVLNRGRGDVWIDLRWPGTLVYAACALLAVPWVWALATWLPGGRMALGGAALLILVLGLGVSAVLRQCPNLQQTLEWHKWAWGMVPLGLAVAAISWVRGRRGGSNFRSARFGLSTLALGLLPPATWLGSQVWEYHHPDLRHAVELRIDGLSPDLRYAIGRGTSHAQWPSVPLRIDLETGAVEQLGSIHAWLRNEVLRPYRLLSIVRQRYWRLADDAPGEALFDVTTGARTSVTWDRTAREIELPAHLRREIEAEYRATTPFTAPGGRSAVVVGDMLDIEQADGTVRRLAWPEPRTSITIPSGHGISVHSNSQVTLFDLTRERIVTPPGSARWTGARAKGIDLQTEAWTGAAVRGLWLLHAIGQQREWKLFDPEHATMEPCPELKGTQFVALLNDDEALVARARTKSTPAELLAYRPADRRSVTVTLPIATGGKGAPLVITLAHRDRDAQGRLWLCAAAAYDLRRQYFAIDPATRECELLPVGNCTFLAFADERHVLVLEEECRVVRIDYVSGARTVLFPRPEATE